MQLSFESKALRAICENETEAKSKLGTKAASLLQHRLADLEAASSIDDLLLGNPRLRDGAGGDTMVLDLCDGYIIAFTANHEKNPVTEDNQLDWGRVTRIKIIDIVSDHG